MKIRFMHVKGSELFLIPAISFYQSHQAKGLNLIWIHFLDHRFLIAIAF